MRDVPPGFAPYRRALIDESWARGCLTLAAAAACLRMLSWALPAPVASRTADLPRLPAPPSPRQTTHVPIAAPQLGASAPPPGDVLSVVPLPEPAPIHLMSASTAPLRELAQQAAAGRVTGLEQPTATASHPGTGYELQLASFRDCASAAQYVEWLRGQGHPAHAREAEVPQSGLWHRVQIGPFEHEREALDYRNGLEPPERAAALLVRANGRS